MRSRFLNRRFVEAAECRSLVVEDLENSIQFRNQKEILYAGYDVQQLQLAAEIGERGERRTNTPSPELSI